MKFKVGDRVKIVCNNYSESECYIGEYGEISYINHWDGEMSYGVDINGKRLYFAEDEIAIDEQNSASTFDTEVVQNISTERIREMIDCLKRVTQMLNDVLGTRGLKNEI